MKIYHLIGICILFVFLTSLALCVPEVWVDDDFNAGNAGGHTWGVDAFATITAGIAAADAGGTVNVAAGMYNESILITKSLNLLGAQAGVDPRTMAGLRTAGSAEESIIDGNGATNVIFLQDSNITVNGFEVKNSSSDCIGFDAIISNAVVKYCIVHDTGDEGIQFKNASNSLMEYNLAFDNGQDGFSFASSNNCTIRNCEVYNSTSENGAIYIYYGYGITVEGNLIHNTTASNGIKVYKMYNNGSLQVILRGNVIENNDFIGRKTAQDGCGILLYKPQENMGTAMNTSVLVEANLIKNNTGNGRSQPAGSAGHGIYWYTSNIFGLSAIPLGIEGNTIMNNGGWGVYIQEFATPGLMDNFTANHNNLIKNAKGDFNNTVAGKTANAILNYWGQRSGPMPAQLTGNINTSPWAFFTPVYVMMDAFGGTVALDPALNDYYKKHSVNIPGLNQATMFRLRTPADRHGTDTALEIVLDPGTTLSGNASMKIEYKYPQDVISPYTVEQLRVCRWGGSSWEPVTGSTNNWPIEFSVEGDVSAFSIFGAFPDPGTVPVEISVFSIE